MPDPTELQRDDSSTRIIFTALDTYGPMTQQQLSMRLHITISCACKCLRVLAEEGYVKRIKRTFNRKGSSIGKLPWLYARTVKPLPEVPIALPPIDHASALQDAMNAMIRGQREIFVE
jgi:predicted ArsR family transcriptional regulator